MATVQDVFLGKTNDTTPRTTGLTRGIVAAALVGAMNAVLVFLPIDPDQEVAFIAAMNPVVILISYVLYGFMDHLVKKHSDDD